MLLKNALVAKCEDLLRLSSIPRCDARMDSEMLAEFRWEGHWVVWESEWVSGNSNVPIGPRRSENMANSAMVPECVAIR